ncbi:MAG: site-2 protease family protein, partial [Actinomycetia bacterium]|nr:site-2 protease family protein [Actinomycetes bacterium]
MLTTIYIIILVALGIGTLILAHEFGHFLGAKLMGVKVEEFMIGLPGPKIFSFKRNETEYGITWLLIGGYVKMLSEYHEEIDEDDKERAFSYQPFWKRFIIMISGPFMNFVLPVIIVTFLILGQGIFIPTTTIEAVEVNSPAFEAGIEKGDKIIKVNDNSVGQWAEVIRIIQDNPGKEVQFVVKRNNKNIELKAVLDDKEGKGFLGITSKVINEKGTFFVAIYKSIKFNFAVSVSIVRLTYQIIAENIFFKV